MNWFEYESDRNMFYFNSDGGAIRVVLFAGMGHENVYAVTFGELQDDASIDIQSAKKKNDNLGVLSTVAKSIAFFLSDHPDAEVVIEGTTPARNRLYQIAILQELRDLGCLFDIYGFDGYDQELFKPDKTYKAFIVSLKKEFQA